jgi:transcriptional regulator with XRE-family HTH domain
MKVAGMTDMRLAPAPRGLPELSRQADDLWQVGSAEQIDIYVGGRLRARRTELGISQGRLGRQLGLSFSQVQKYEKGSNRIGAGRLYQVAELLGVSVLYFFDGLKGGAPEIAGKSAPVTADTGRVQDVFARISDPEVRHALISLASSMADKD